MMKKLRQNCAIGQLFAMSDWKDAWTKMIELSRNTLSEILALESIVIRTKEVNDD